MALLTELKALADAGKAKDELAADTMIVLQAVGGFYTLIGQAVETISAKCAKHGLPALLAALPEATGDKGAAEKVYNALILLQSLWTQYSDVPMPEFYDKPYVAPVVEEV